MRKMNMTKIFTLSILLFVVTGCANSPKKINPVETSNVATQTEQDDKLLPKGAIPTSTNSCIDDMMLLKQTRYEDYKEFSKQYSEIMDEFNFLRKNSEIMDKDTKRYLTNSLIMKQESLCNKVKYSAFLSVKEKMATLTST